jgi:hypothetical protein
MNEQLIKFIELCLADGVISDKEREVIFRKAKSLGVDEDECEILIDSYPQQVNKISETAKPVTLKPKRNFTPKTVEKIKPAALNQEKKLLEDLAKLKDEEKKISANYDLLLDDLKIKAREVNKIKTETLADFEKFRENFVKDLSSLNDKYINTINQEVSKKFGVTEMILTSKQKTSLKNLKLNKKKAFILKNSKWDFIHVNSHVNSKRRRKLTLLYFFGLLQIAYAIIEAEFDMDDMKSGNWFMVGIGIFIIVGIEVYNLKIKENTMNFKDDDIKSIIDKVDKSLKIAFDQLESNREKINNYFSLSKYDLSIPPKKNKLSHS